MIEMIKSGYRMSENNNIDEAIDDSMITKDDKVTLAKLRKEISSYPTETYLRCAIKGNINDISRYTYGKVKIAKNEWKPYSSIFGVDTSAKSMTDNEVISFIENKGIKNIGIRFPKVPVAKDSSLPKDKEGIIKYLEEFKKNMKKMYFL